MPQIPRISIGPLQHPNEAHACARFMADSEPWLTLRRGYEDGLRALRDSTREVYVAWVGDALAGFIILNLSGPLNGYVQTVCVAPEWRNRGVGHQLLAFAEARIFRQSPNVFLCVSSFNADAQRFYDRLGYQRIGELRDYVVQGHSEILMRKTLGPLAGFQPPSSSS